MTKRDIGHDGVHRPRPSTIFLRIAAVTVLAGGALAACGDDGGGEDPGPGAGGTAGVEDFCASMKRVNVILDSRGFFESEDGDVAPALEAVGDIAPPEEVESQWRTVIQGTEKAADLERNDGGRFEKTPESEQAADRILSYVDVQCSVDLTS